MARLCVFALEEGVETDYVRSLIEKRGLVPDRPPLNVDAWPWQFRVRTLGQFELLRDGKTSLLKGRGQGRPIEVLKMAIAMGGTNVSVDRITDALWPNIDRDYAHRSFNTTLHRLRKLLGEDTSVTLTNNQLTLNDQFFWLDTWAFEQSLDQLRKALNRNLETDDIQAIVDRVLELYQGGFLPGDEDSACVFSPREQLRNKFSRFINDVGHWLEQQQRFDDAVEFYFRGLEVDELAESIYRRLMLCFQGLGRRAEAIDVYNRCCKTLESRLGVSPSRETTDLYDTMVSAA